MEKFKNKYRIPSARAAFWDYSNDAHYFITICTHHRVHWFGKVVNGEMILSEMGKLAFQAIMQIPKYFSFADIEDFVVMPNHVHLIVSIDQCKKVSEKEEKLADDFNGTHSWPNHSEKERFPDAFGHTPDRLNGFPSNRNEGLISDSASSNVRSEIPKDKNPMSKDHLAKVIRWYKGRVKYESRLIQPDFKWQSRFHDHIIRDELAHERIKLYIRNNPIKWENDCFIR